MAKRDSSQSPDKDDRTLRRPGLISRFFRASHGKLLIAGMLAYTVIHTLTIAGDPSASTTKLSRLMASYKASLGGPI